MIKNWHDRAGTRAGYASAVAFLVALAWLVLHHVPEWWVVSAIAVVGLPATYARLKRLGLSRWLTLPTFVPGVGIVVATALIVAAPRRRDASAHTSQPSAGDVVLGIVATVPIGVAFAFLTTNVLGSYGWTLFVSLPFVLGLLTTLFSIARGDRPFVLVLSNAVAATLLTGLALFLVGLEGAICLFMAAPLALPLALLGAATGQALHRMQRSGALLGIGILLPALLAGELTGGQEATLHRVTTQLVVAAPPRVVWNRLVSFPPLPVPREAVFRLGLAYPVDAVIQGRGVGAIRRCRFSTGDFVEPITVWDAPRRLGFDVASQPEPMTELSPYDAVHAPHLEGFLTSERGEFRLVPVAGNRTLLIGSTWYRNRMWPTAYWRLWSDTIIHRIHRRVLRHIRDRAEADLQRHAIR